MWTPDPTQPWQPGPGDPERSLRPRPLGPRLTRVRGIATGSKDANRARGLTAGSKKLLVGSWHPYANRARGLTTRSKKASLLGR